MCHQLQVFCNTVYVLSVIFVAYRNFGHARNRVLSDLSQMRPKYLLGQIVCLGSRNSSDLGKKKKKNYYCSHRFSGSVTVSIDLFSLGTQIDFFLFMTKTQNKRICLSQRHTDHKYRAPQLANRKHTEIQAKEEIGKQTIVCVGKTKVTKQACENISGGNQKHVHRRK